MRLIGFLIRLSLIIFGSLVFFVFVLVGLTVFIIWFVLPFVIISGLILGIKLLL